MPDHNGLWPRPRRSRKPARTLKPGKAAQRMSNGFGRQLRGGAAVCCCALIALAAMGCQRAQSRSSLVEVNSAYRSGDYRTAFAQAQGLVEASSGPTRESAAYMAGKAARHMGDAAAAQRYLQLATRSRDAELAGQALAELGLLYAELHRDDLAETALLDAAARLTGQDRAHAFLHAGLAQQKQGRWMQAHANFELAQQMSADAPFRENIRQQLAVAGFTLQFGAFSSAANAQRTAQQVAVRTAPLHIGEPRLLPARDAAGKPLYLVQVGRFPSYTLASRARDQARAGDSIIVPLSTVVP